MERSIRFRFALGMLSATLNACITVGEGSSFLIFLDDSIDPAFTGPPIFSYASDPLTLPAGQTIDIGPSGTGALPITYSISPAATFLPMGLSFDTNTGRISGTVPATFTSTSFTVTANNAEGMGTYSFLLEVQELPPNISYPTSTLTAYNGVPIASLVATNAGSPATYSVAPGLPAGLSLNATTGEITGTFAGTPSSIVYTITATNPSTTPMTDTFALTISTQAGPAHEASLSSGSSSISAGTCQPILVALRDSSGNPTNYGSPIAVALARESGTLYSSASCSGGTEITSINVSSTAGTTFYFRSTVGDSFDPVTIETTSLTLDGSIAITVNPGAAVALFATTYNASPVAGVAETLVIEARDSFGNRATGYLGAGFSFSSSDGSATLPGGFNFTALDLGVRTFSGTLLWRTAGPQTLSVSGPLSLSPSSLAVTVAPGTPAGLTIVSFNSAPTAGIAQTVSVQASDAFGNRVTTYTSAGNAFSFSSSDPSATLPANFDFLAGDLGLKTFSSALTWATSGAQTLSISGPLSLSPTPATVAPGPAYDLVLALDDTTPGANDSVTVDLEAWDAYGNLATSYNGTANISSTDAQSVRPSSVVFAAGVASFVIQFRTQGAQSVSAQDSGSPSISGSSPVATVAPGPAHHFSITNAASTTVTSGALFASQPILRLEDQWNNWLSSAAGTATLAAFNGGTCVTAASGAISGNAVAVSGGLANFSSLMFTGPDSSISLRADYNAGALAGGAQCIFTSITVSPPPVGTISWRNLNQLNLDLQEASSSDTFTVTIENTGSYDVNVTGVGSLSPPFSYVSEDCTSLSPLTPAETCTLTLSYTLNASDYGIFQTPISVFSNGNTLNGTLRIVGNGPTHIQKIVIGSNHACAINFQNDLYCWGRNIYGEVGDGTAIQRDTPVLISVGGGLDVIDVAVSLASTCAITDSNDLYCWGQNTSGQLGLGHTTNQNTPQLVSVTLPADASLVGPKGNGMCVADEVSSNQYELRCWGASPLLGWDNGGLGLESANLAIPVEDSLGNPVRFAKPPRVGSDFGCGVVEDAGTRKVFCWGNDSNRQLGNDDGTPTRLDYAAPVYTGPGTQLTNINEVLVGSGFACAARLDVSQLSCWGQNNNLQGYRTSPTTLEYPNLFSSFPSFAPVNQAAAGSIHTCLVIGDEMRCWGSGAGGRLGNGSISNSAVVVQPSSFTNGWVSVAAGNPNTCGIRWNGAIQEVRCWGLRDYGVLGIPTPGVGNQLTPAAPISF